MKNHYFKWGSKVYKQVAGPPMGIILSPLFCLIFMSEWERSMRNDIDLYGSFVEIWRRYVDDVIGIWTGSVQEFQNFVERCNKIHKNIQFTSELENGGLVCLNLQLRLIDSVQKYPGRLELQYEHYRKPTASDQVVHYHSANDKCTKQNYVTSTICTILANCSQISLAHPHIVLFQERLKKGGWPDPQIRRLTAIGVKRYNGKLKGDGSYEYRSRERRHELKTINERTKALQRVRDDQPETVRWSINCFHNKEFLNTCNMALKVCKLDNVVQVREKCGNKLVHTCGAVDFKPFSCAEKRKLCSVCTAPKHPKYPKPKCDQTGVIYIFFCNICSDEYIGQTERPFHIRFKEHHKKLTVAELNKHK